MEVDKWMTWSVTMNALHYLLTTGSAGISAIILFLIGLVLLASSAISLHNDNAFSTADHEGLSRRMFGVALILAAILLITIRLIEGHSGISHEQYKHLIQLQKADPKLAPIISKTLSQKTRISRLKYHSIIQLENTSYQH